LQFNKTSTVEHHNLECKVSFHQSYQFVFRQTKFLTCSPPFFCPFAYNAHWKMKINFIMYFTTYKCLHYNAKIKIAILFIFGHVMQDWRDICAYFTLFDIKSLEKLSSFVAYWVILFLACPKDAPSKGIGKLNSLPRNNWL